MIAAIAVMEAPVAARGTCAGDCDGSGAVTIQELILAVDVALGSAAVGDCAAVDTDHDGKVTINELIVAVDRALNGCSATPTPTFAQGMLITGGCTQPGPSGLKPCASGTGIVVWRCDATGTCIQHIESRTRLGDGAIGASGGFAITVDAAQAGSAALLMEASVSHATLFRTMGFGKLGGGSAAFRRAAVVAATLSVTIDPSSEAAVRLLDEQGLDQFGPDGVLAVIAAVRAANQGTSFAGLDPEAAAEKALAVARLDPGVQQALLTYRFTATPTATGSATVTHTVSATTTATASPLPTATRTQTHSATATATRTQTHSATATATRTQTHSATATATRTQTNSATATATGTAPATTTATGSPPATATPTRTGSSTATSTTSSTATRTVTPPATATPTRTGSSTATPTTSSTATRTATPSATATRTRSNSATATATRTASPTFTVTLTRTPTGTPPPFLQAQLTTDHGCLESNMGAAYTVGEQARVFFRVDGVASGGVPITEAHVKVAYYSDGHLDDVADIGSPPTGMPLELVPPYDVLPPPRTETLRLLADAASLMTETQCSFSVLPSSCMTTCDCAAGQHCDMGTCVVGGGAPYCCTSTTCPLGFDCQFPNGTFGTCPG